MKTIRLAVSNNADAIADTECKDPRFGHLSKRGRCQLRSEAWRRADGQAVCFRICGRGAEAVSPLGEEMK